MLSHSIRFLLLTLLLTLAACETPMPPPTSAAMTPALLIASSGIHAHASTSAALSTATPPASAPLLLTAWGSAPICRALNDSDRIHDQQAERRACTAPIGQKVTWNNPDTGASGTIVAVSDGYDNSGAYCRDFVQTLTLNNQTQQRHSKACQKADGSWTIVP